MTTDTRRDPSLGDMDSFQMIFDTFHDKQNGFVFGTNAAGVQYDAQVRFQGDQQASWDGSWDVATGVTDTAWTAEFRIPLRTLRYGPAPQTWGVNFFRNIQRTRERAYWAPIERVFNLGRLSSAGDLRGLQLETPRNFKLLPYAVGSANRNFTPGASTDFDGDIGLDAKFGVTPSLNLDATLNTDFAQVEVDTQQINLTRFNLRFPEKRPFFQENSGLFTIGKGSELDLFFSRRIGLDENGGAGADSRRRAPERQGRRRERGRAEHADGGGPRPARQQLLRAPRQQGAAEPVQRRRHVREPLRHGRPGRRATIGTGRGARTRGSASASTSRWPALRRAPRRLAAPAATTPSTSTRCTTTAPTRSGSSTGAPARDFNPEVGFLENEFGYRRLQLRFQETMRQDWIREWHFREWLPHAIYTRYDYLDGGLNTAELHVDNHWDWENGYRVDTALQGSWEGFREPFEIYPGVIVPAGEIGGFFFRMNSNTDRRKPISAALRWDVGNFLTGTQNSPGCTVTLRDGGRFTVDTTWNYSAISLPQGSFRTNLGNMRVTYNFSPSMFVQSLVQYNDRTRRWSGNFRFHLLETAGTGLFVVYNNTESLDGLGPVNRAFIVKYVRQFDILR